MNISAKPTPFVLVIMSSAISFSSVKCINFNGNSVVVVAEIRPVGLFDTRNVNPGEPGVNPDTLNK